MSRFAEVVVLAKDAEEIMRHLTEPDELRQWQQCFTPVDNSIFEGGAEGSQECYMWVIQFYRKNWNGLLEHLQSLDWPYPGSVQVLVHDEEDSCFGLWMMFDGVLAEVPLPRTNRVELPSSVTGVLFRTDE